LITQKELILPPKDRGVYIITPQIASVVDGVVQKGIANIFLKHTSASLAINENYDPAVRVDIESFIRSLIPDCWDKFTHTLEGCDDMPGHMKNILIGSSLTVPIKNFKLSLGVWQGIYLLEHRVRGSQREILITVIGE